MKAELESILAKLKTDTEHVLKMCQDKAIENTKLKLEIMALQLENERLKNMPSMYHATKVVELQLEIDNLKDDIENAYNYLKAIYGDLEGCEPEKQIIESFRKVLYA